MNLDWDTLQKQNAGSGMFATQSNAGTGMFATQSNAGTGLFAPQPNTQDEKRI